MSVKELVKKRAVKAFFFCPFLFCLISCHSSLSVWHLEKTLTPCRYYNSGRLYSLASQSTRKWEIELDYGYEGLKMYANLFNFEANRSHATLFLIVTTDQQEYLAVTTVLEGGQRLLLSDESCNHIVNSLLEGKTVALSYGPYKGDLEPANFESRFANLVAISTF